jgi:esterase
MDLNFKTFGQGDPVLILHGLFGTLDNWQTLGKKLAEDHLVFLLDQRNHGRSPHLDSHTYPEMAEDLQHFMEANWVYESALIGHSMGGKTVMNFACQHPDMVNHLVVVDIAPKTYPGGHQHIFDALFSVDIDRVTDRQEVADQLAKFIDEEAIRLFLMKNLARKKEGGFRWKMNLPVIHKYYRTIIEGLDPNLPPFEGPTLFIRGGRSRYITPEDEPLIKTKFPNATIATIENAGHWVHSEAPQKFLKLVSDFLQS